MTKVIINRCYGGFGLSDKAFALYKERTGEDIERGFYLEGYRYDKTLIEIVEQLGEEANGKCSKLEVVEFPSYITYDMLEINEYDGLESVGTDFGNYLYRKLYGCIDEENLSDTDIANIVRDVIKIDKMLNQEKSL